jgi:hypothetical protein
MGITATIFCRNYFFDLGLGSSGNDNTGPVFIPRTPEAIRYILAKQNVYDESHNQGIWSRIQPKQKPDIGGNIV